MPFPVSKEDVWRHFNPNKAGDIYIARFCLVGVGSAMGMVDQRRRIIFMGKKEGMP